MVKAGIFLLGMSIIFYIQYVREPDQVLNILHEKKTKHRELGDPSKVYQKILKKIRNKIEGGHSQSATEPVQDSQIYIQDTSNSIVSRIVSSDTQRTTWKQGSVGKSKFNKVYMVDIFRKDPSSDSRLIFQINSIDLPSSNKTDEMTFELSTREL